MAGIDELYRWLIALSLQVRKPEHVAERIEDVIKLYAEKLTAWPAPTVSAVLERWPSESDWWPTWHELEAALPDPASLTPRITGPSGSRETFTDRVTRLKLHRRLGTIGVGRWKVIMDRHKRIADAELLAVVARLELGQEAFLE